MSEIIYQTNPTEFYGQEKIKEANEYGFLIREKNALILSENMNENKPRFRFKMNRNSKYFSDKIVDVSVVFGIIDTIKQANRFNQTLSVDYILKEIKNNDLVFHHNDSDSMINESNVTLVNDFQHKRFENKLYFKRNSILFSF